MARSITGNICRGGVGSRKQFTHTYEDIISVENLLKAWEEFEKGKRKRADVLTFKHHLIANILNLHNDLESSTYQHGNYHHFKISDPKPRDIHKANVRDRVLHHSIYRQLYPFFDRTFISDSYSCRERKGTHKAMDRFRSFARKISKNNTKTCWVLKCDIRKFFASIDQEILIKILKKQIQDTHTLSLLQNVIGSFDSGTKGKGLPLGNLTSQLLVNIYMNEFDQFVKHKLKAKYYVRYADDFVLLSQNRRQLVNFIPKIRNFLNNRLKLELHPNKVSIQTLSSGVDFLGWVHFPNHQVLRTSTKRRMFRRIREMGGKKETMQSYLGLLRHGNTHKLKRLFPIRSIDVRIKNYG